MSTYEAQQPANLYIKYGSSFLINAVCAVIFFIGSRAVEDGDPNSFCMNIKG